MNKTYFEFYDDKLSEIVEYLNSRNNEDIGTIFTAGLSPKFIIDKELYGKQIKESFNVLERRYKELSQIIYKASGDVSIIFFRISNSIFDQMSNNLRTIAVNIEELENINDRDGEVYNLFEIDRRFRECYQNFLMNLSIAQTSINHLNSKISNELSPKFDEKNNEIDRLVEDLKLYKGEASARKTKEIYKKKYEDYKKTVEIYEFYVMLLMCLSVALVLGQLFAHNFFDALNISNALMIKLTILALITTLFTYCFKQIGFYRKISEQAHQTYMELEALPEFLTHLPEEKQHEIRADLAKRYFGQNLFDSIKEDSASIQEQAKANTEVLKSTSTLLEVIKKQNSQS